MSLTIQIPPVELPDGTFTEQLRSILHGGETLKLSKAGENIEINWYRMYEAPAFNVRKLMALCALFGTEDIEMEGYSSGGCETCDWGSQYGHDFTVRGATKNVNEAKAVFGVDLEKQQ